MEDLRIDPVTPDTLAPFDRALRELSATMGDTHRAGAATLGAALFSDPPACHGLLVRGPGAGDAAPVLGAALFSPVMSTSLGAAGTYVSDLWVAEAARGRALGPRLLGAVARRAEALWQARYLRLAVYADNTRARAFYDRLGFAALDAQSEMILREDGFARLREI